MEIIVIQCAASKHGKPLIHNREKGGTRTRASATKRPSNCNSLTHNGEKGGTPLSFVANPMRCPEPGFPCVSPDACIPTWREHLVEYNNRFVNSGENPCNLLQAVELYEHYIYRELADKFGRENVYILSAGWGLVRGDYLLPDYNISFSSAQNVPMCSRRKNNLTFQDFNHLANRTSNNADTIYFFGGLDYLKLFYSLTGNINRMRKVIYYKSHKLNQEEERKPGYDYIRYETNRITNWHYSCAKDFMEGKIPR